MSDVADRGKVGAIAPVMAIVRRPRLWGEAVRSLFALAPDRWWKQRPFLPVPEPAYLSWRTATAYGRSDAEMEAGDVVAYLEWRRTFRRATST